MTSTVKSEWSMCCPNCGKDDELEISCMIWVQLVPDGTDTVTQDNEWDDSSPCQCDACGHKATVKDFELKAGVS